MNEAHPTVTELLDLVMDDRDVRTLEPHLEDCLACHIRLSRLRDEHGYEPPDDEVISRLLSASRSLGVATRKAAAASQTDAAPRGGELWRAGRDHAIMVWVRKEVSPTILDVVPVVLDTELADEQSLLVDSEESPLGVDLAVMTSLRTHIHRSAFLSPVGHVSISGDVENLISGRSAVAHSVGAPILSGHDQRIEYRQALGDLLSDLSPVIWQEATQPIQLGLTAQDSASSFDQWNTELEVIAADLMERVKGAALRPVRPLEASSPSGRFRSLAKATYLDTTVLIVAADDTAGRPVARDLAQGAEPLLDVDIDAVAVCRPASAWEATLITRADMRPAHRASGGDLDWPRVTLEGMDLLDTLHKHFERAAVAWDVVEQADRTLVGPDIEEVASSHAREALNQVRLSGGRARPPKKEVWLNLSDAIVDQVSRMVGAASDNDIDRALEQLGLDQNND